jgi:hypothetical protein
MKQPEIQERGPQEPRDAPASSDKLDGVMLELKASHYADRS